jgi:hypothetical protein
MFYSSQSPSRGLAAACGLLFLLSGLGSASAIGALAIGVTGDIAKDGYSLGATVNHDNEASARKAALDWCNTHGSKKTQGKCKVVEVFRNQCVAESLDPKVGTPGAGWAIGPDRATAENRATEICKASAGRSRRDFCRIEFYECVTKP